MKVRMNAQISGTRDGEEWPALGEIVDLPEDEAKGLLHAGLAVPIKRDDVETATAREPETATQRTTPKRRGLTKADLP